MWLRGWWAIPSPWRKVDVGTLRNSYDIPMSADTNNCDLQNIENQRLLSSWEISVSSPRFAKRAATNENDVSRRSFCPQQATPSCVLTHDSVTMLSNSQGWKLSDIGFILQLRHNGTEIQRSQQRCHLWCYSIVFSVLEKFFWRLTFTLRKLMLKTIYML